MCGRLPAVERPRAALERERVFKVIDRISSSPPDAAINEDAVGATMSAAWAIDGATGVSDRPPLVVGTTDAAWLAGELNAALHAAFDRPDAELEPALAGVEAKLRADFLAIDRQPGTPAGEQPTAALAVAALRGETLHLIGIGDCRIIYEERTGEVGEFNPSAIGPAEALIVAERRRLMTQYPGEDPWPRLKAFIRPLRERANQEGGYSVVHPTRSWSTRVVRRDARTPKNPTPSAPERRPLPVGRRIHRGHRRRSHASRCGERAEPALCGTARLGRCRPRLQQISAGQDL